MENLEKDIGVRRSDEISRGKYSVRGCDQRRLSLGHGRPWPSYRDRDRKKVRSKREKKMDPKMLR